QRRFQPCCEDWSGAGVGPTESDWSPTSCVLHCRNSYPELCSAICSCQKSRFEFPPRGKLRHVLSRCRWLRRYGSSPRVGSLAVSASLTEESGTGSLPGIC